VSRPNKPSRAMSWDGFWGVCFFNDVHLTLYKAPVIPGLHLEQIDYAPLVRQRSVLERGGTWRELTAAEAVEVDKVLERMVKAAVAEVCGP
jgi:hypothetical protein